MDDSGKLVLEIVKSTDKDTAERTRVWMTPQEAQYLTDKILSACTTAKN